MTQIRVSSSVSFCVILQTWFRCKPFLTHCTHIRPWLVIMWLLTDIFNLDLKWTPCICTNALYS